MMDDIVNNNCQNEENSHITFMTEYLMVSRGPECPPSYGIVSYIVCHRVGHQISKFEIVVKSVKNRWKPSKKDFYNDFYHFWTHILCLRSIFHMFLVILTIFGDF